MTYVAASYPGYSPYGYGGWTPPPQQATTVSLTNARMGGMRVDELRMNIHSSNPWDPRLPDLSRPGTYTADVAALRAATSDADLGQQLSWYMRYSDTSDLQMKFREDGIAQLNGKMKMLGIKVPFQMDLKIGVDGSRNVVIDVTKTRAFGFLPVPQFMARDLFYGQMKKADPGDSSAPLITPYGNMDYLLVNTHVIYAANHNLQKRGSSKIVMDLQRLPAPVNLNLNSIQVTRGQLSINAGTGGNPAAVAGSLGNAGITPFFSDLARQGRLN